MFGKYRQCDIIGLFTSVTIVVGNVSIQTGDVKDQ